MTKRSTWFQTAGKIAAAASALAVLALGGCGDHDNVWPRYQLERSLYGARQEMALSSLQSESGRPQTSPALVAAYERTVDMFRHVTEGSTEADSAVFAIGGEAIMQLANLYLTDSNWTEARARFEQIIDEPRFQPQYQRMALMGLGRIAEQTGDYAFAAAHYRSLLDAFYPPVGDAGVNQDVLALPRHLVALADREFPDSVSAWEQFASKYYDSLAMAYPATEIGVAALGEKAKLETQLGRWQEAITTLERATDTSGTIIPPYWIDIGEISAGRLGDTDRAISVYAKVAEAFPDSPFRADADLKRCQLLMKRKDYAQVREILSELKDEFEDRSAAILPAQLLYASAFEAEGNWERAKNEYLYLVTTYPTSLQAVEAALAVARHFVASGETGREAEWYNRADELAAELAQPRRYSATTVGRAMDLRVGIAVEQKKWDAAATRLGDIVNTFTERSPAGAVALVRLGWLNLRERADTLAAGQAWRRFLDAYPTRPEGDALRQEMNKWPNNLKQDLSS